MNAFSRIATEFEPVSYADWSYQMGFDDFTEIHATRTDVLSGRTWVCGRNKLGLLIQAPIGVPLCSGCDLPITDSLCPDCGNVFVEDEA